MLLIRPEQINAIKTQAVQEFVTKVVGRIQQDLAQQCQLKKLKQDDLTKLAYYGIQKSQSYGIVSEDDVELFIQCMVVLDPAFDTNVETSWAKKILNSNDLKSEEKIEEIVNFIIFCLDIPPTENPFGEED